MKKNKTENSTLFIDASREFVKVTKKNKLSETNIENILRLFTERKDEDYVSKVVPNSEIEAQEYNLSVSTYVEKEDTRYRLSNQSPKANLGSKLEECLSIPKRIHINLRMIATIMTFGAFPFFCNFRTNFPK